MLQFHAVYITILDLMNFLYGDDDHHLKILLKFFPGDIMEYR